MALDTNTKNNQLSFSDETLQDRWSKAGRGYTSLTNRILRVNLISLLFLVLGVIYLDQYREDLIKAELDTLSSEVRLLSATFSEGSIRRINDNNPEDNEAIISELAKRLINRLSQSSKSHIRIFDTNLQIIGDTRSLDQKNNIIIKEELKTPKINIDSEEIINKFFSNIIKHFPMKYDLPLYSKLMEQNENAHQFPDIHSALNGEVSFRAWRDGEGELVLTAAAPIEKDNKIYGTVLIKRDGANITEAIIRMQRDILKVFAGAVTVTILLSLYLAAIIGHPLRRLAISAENVSNSKSRKIEIDDLSERNDEIGALSTSLRDMTRALWNRMDSIEQFSADVSHELKNPLSSLKSAVETMEKINKKEQKEQLMNIIHHDIERLDRLITDISKASRLDAELSRDVMNKFNPCNLISELINAYKKPLERINSTETSNENNIKLIIDSKSRNTEIIGNEIRISQIFENLISNALSFTPENEVVIIRINSTEKDIIITIEDNGIGIPPENLETIFKRFYSLRPTHEKYGSHSGLGLSICRQIINTHNGKIYADNIIDYKNNIKGAKFTVILPRA